MSMDIDKNYTDLGLERTSFHESLLLSAHRHPALHFERDRRFVGGVNAAIRQNVFVKLPSTADSIIINFWRLRDVLKAEDIDLTLDFLLRHKIIKNTESARVVRDRKITEITNKEIAHWIFKRGFSKKAPVPWELIRVNLTILHAIKQSPLLFMSAAERELFFRLRPLTPDPEFRKDMERCIDNFLARPKP